MASQSQKSATKSYRKRSKRAGLVRVEVQAPKEYSELIKSVAKTLRENPDSAFEVRKAISGSEKPLRKKTSLEMFAGPVDVSGPEFDEIFNQPRDGKWRKIEF